MHSFIHTHMYIHIYVCMLMVIHEGIDTMHTHIYICSLNKCCTLHVNDVPSTHTYVHTYLCVYAYSHSWMHRYNAHTHTHIHIQSNKCCTLCVNDVPSCCILMLRIVWNHLQVDVEEHPYLTRIESVTFIPTFKLYKNGQKVKEILGPSEQTLEHAVKHYSL